MAHGRPDRQRVRRSQPDVQSARRSRRTGSGRRARRGSEPVGSWRLMGTAAPGPVGSTWPSTARCSSARPRGERWLRLYALGPACLSFGRHEPAARRYDRGAITALGLAVVRRPTGGRAVWHAGELTYARGRPGGGLGSLREALPRDPPDAARRRAPPGYRGRVGTAGAARAARRRRLLLRRGGGEVMVGRPQGGGQRAAPRRTARSFSTAACCSTIDQAIVRGSPAAAPPPDHSAPLAGCSAAE